VKGAKKWDATEITAKVITPVIITSAVGAALPITAMKIISAEAVKIAITGETAAIFAEYATFSDADAEIRAEAEG